MRIGTLRRMCAAAVACALAVPAVAQDTPTAEGSTTQSPNAARGAEGEAGTVQSGRSTQPGTTTNVQPRTGIQQGTTLQPGQTRPGAPPAGTIIEERSETQLQPGTRTANYPPGQRQGRINNQALARYIAAGNEAEVRINEFARQQAQNEQVKQFAEKMVQEHTKFGQQLAQAAGSGSSNEPGASSRSATTIEERTTRPNIRDESANQNEDEPRSDEASPDRSNRRRDRDEARQNQDATNRDTARTQTQTRRETQIGASGGQSAQGANNPFVSLHEQIKEQCAQSTIQALREKQGPEFDHAFMHQQVLEHMAMLDTLKVAQQQASGQLQQVLQQGQQATQQHLQEAKQILAQLDNQRQQR